MNSLEFWTWGFKADYKGHCDTCHHDDEPVMEDTTDPCGWLFCKSCYNKLRKEIGTIPGFINIREKKG